MQYLKYHSVVYERAFKEAIRFFGYSRQNIFLALITTLIVGFVTYDFLGLSAMIESWATPVLIALGAALAFFVAVFIDKLIITPAELYIELGGFNELTLVVIPICDKPTADGWLTFELRNESKQQITQCYALLEAVTKDSDPNYEIAEPLMLQWSSRNPPIYDTKDIIAGGHVRVDIAKAYRTENVMRYTVQKAYPSPISSGNFSVRLTIRCIYNTDPFNCSFELKFTYKGGADFLCDMHGKSMKLTPERIVNKSPMKGI